MLLSFLQSRDFVCFRHRVALLLGPMSVSARAPGIYNQGCPVGRWLLKHRGEGFVGSLRRFFLCVVWLDMYVYMNIYVYIYICISIYTYCIDNIRNRTTMDIPEVWRILHTWGVILSPTSEYICGNVSGDAYVPSNFFHC